jgi:D-alanyl-D-alanine carboxypeptidase/D-alanyl-D-alanine-endopeptidase (penicillin-binding protein 4)
VANYHIHGRKYRIHDRWFVFCVFGFLLLFDCPAEGQKHAKQVNCCSAVAKTAFEAKELLEESAQRFATRVETILSGEQPSKGEWGILVVDAKSGQVLLAQNADRYFVPASNMKLFTTAFALATLGPDYRFRTTLEAQNPVSSEGKLDGSLFLVGRGDPNLSNRKFPFDAKEEFDGPPEKVIAELADKVVAGGVKEISGDIVGDDSYFPRERYPNGWEIDDMVWEYGAAVSAIVVDDNTVALTLTPGEKLGDKVSAEVEPATMDFVVNNLVTTSAMGVKPDLTLKREPGSNTVTVLGTLPAKSKPRKLVLAVEEPALHASAMLKRLLEERGIAVRGAARAQSVSTNSAGRSSRTVLATHLSIPLGESIKLVNKISQNLHTESLLRTSAQEACLHPSAAATPSTATPARDCTLLTSDDYAAFAAKFYADAGILTGDVVQTDGSGLSRHDLTTPRALVATLEYAAKQAWFPVFYDSLPVAGLDGTLEDRMKNSAATMRIHAKSGSLEHVRTRSGYAELPNGRRLIFSFMSNNMGSKGHEATEALDALSAAMIEEFGAEAAGCCKSKE